jgi:hypothetical protein
MEKSVIFSYPERSEGSLSLTIYHCNLGFSDAHPSRNPTSPPICSTALLDCITKFNPAIHPLVWNLGTPCLNPRATHREHDAFVGSVNHQLPGVVSLDILRPGVVAPQSVVASDQGSSTVVLRSRN